MVKYFFFRIHKILIGKRTKNSMKCAPSEIVIILVQHEAMFSSVRVCCVLSSVALNNYKRRSLIRVP